MKISAFLILFVITYLHTSAQDSVTVRGVVKDSTGQLLIGANVSFITATQSLYQSTDINGTFKFVSQRPDNFKIKVSILGYNSYEHNYSLLKENNDISIPTIILHGKTNTLKEIVIKGKAQIMTLKDDTIEYKISQFKLRENAVLEDLIKRLPGMSVDADGQISFMGKPISKIRINGKDFPISNIQDLTHIMSIDMLEKVQLINDYGITAGITGRKIGQAESILNLQTNSELKKSKHLKLSIGGGTSGKYNTSIFGALLKKNDELITTATSNNSESNIGESTNSNINTSYTHNYKNLKSQISLSANESKNKSSSSSNQQTITPDGSLIYDDDNSLENRSNSYSLKVQEEYQSPKIGQLYFTSSGYIIKSQYKSLTNSIQTGIQNLNRNTTNNNHQNSPEINIGLLYALPFKKENRALVVNINSDRKIEKEEQLSYNDLKYFKNNTTIDSIYYISINKNNNKSRVTFQINYLEPLTKTASIEVKYGMISQKNNYNLSTFQLDKNDIPKYIDSLSNHYKYSSSLQFAEANLKNSYKNIEYIVGITSRFLKIKSNTADLPQSSWQQIVSGPYIQLTYKPITKSYIKFDYVNYLSQPEYNQIQPIPDKSNFQAPVIGNPQLKASTNNDFNLEYTNVGNIIYQMNMKMNIIQNKIVTNTILIQDSLNSIIQETHFLNSQGNYDASVRYSISKQFNEGKYSISFDGENGFSNSIYYINSEKEISKNSTNKESLKIRTSQKYYEIMGDVTFNYNKTIYILDQPASSDYHNWGIRIDGKGFLPGNWLLGFNIRKQFNSNVSNNNGQNPMILGAKIEKSIWMNQLTFSLQGYNLLDQVSNFTQIISSNTTTRTTNNLTGRFLLFSAILQLKKIQKD